MHLDHTRNALKADVLRILRIDASGRQDNSVSRSLATELIARLEADHGRTAVSVRDLAVAPPGFVTEAWIEATFTPADERNVLQRTILRESDELVGELMAADLLVIATPIYNFGVPAALKAWIDMIARAQLTFRYTEKGPEGLLHDKRAILVAASGGTEVGSSNDFATTYLRHALGFIGIEDVEVIAADRLLFRGDEGAQAARQHIARIAPAEPAAATAA